MSDQEFFCIDSMFKAQPREEGGRRFVYMQASDESVDHQGEVVLSKALQESAPYFLKYGNIDLDHRTQMGPVAGQPSHHLFEIGKPVDVRADGKKTFVKAEIYGGEGPTVEHANIFWDSLTRQHPPKHWFPSVGGDCHRSKVTDPKTGRQRPVIDRVRWTNIGMSGTPVNLHVPTVAVVPFGALAKSMAAGAFSMRKALEAGYGTDMAELSGGAALRSEMPDPHLQNYWDFRDRLAGDIRAGRVKPSVDALVAHVAKDFDVDPDRASELVERFLSDLQRGREQRTRHD